MIDPVLLLTASFEHEREKRLKHDALASKANPDRTERV